MFMPVKILVPTDFSPQSDKALGEALDIAQKYKAGVHLLHVIPRELDLVCRLDYCIRDTTIVEIQGQAVSGAWQSLKDQIEKVSPPEDVDIVTEVRQGHPAEEILKVQQEQAADLIVMATLGRTGLEKFLIGSVANNVVKNAPCRVLLVR